MAQLIPSPLFIKEKHRLAILAQAEAGRPNEICGVILGNEYGSIEVVPVENVAATPATTFTMSPPDLLAILERADQEPLEILTFYHSHPNSEPTPSPTDLAQAYYPEIPMLIIGWKNDAWTLKAYFLKKDHYTPVPLHFQ
ncbi:MAG TPA: M67 family metallopeptidase [Anaerolineales bacterium]|nr:M67 family metallopeptidase [Anaerolineales bacterium]